MSENAVTIAVLVAYFGVAVLILGVLLGTKTKSGEDATLGDLFAALIWPITLLLGLGFGLGLKGGK